MSKRKQAKLRQDKKYLFLIIPIILIAVLLVYYLLHQQQNNFSSGSKSSVNEEQSPEALVGVRGTVYDADKKAEGEITIGVVKAVVKNGEYEIKEISPGFYKTIFVGKDKQRRLLNPDTVRIYPGNSQILDFTVINQP